MDRPLFQTARPPSPHEEELEWLETDGRGGYALGTIAGRPDRQYHGWLVAPVPGSSRRFLALSRVEEHVLPGPGREALALSVVRYPDGVLHPRGHENLARFELCPYPRAEYRLGDAAITRSWVLVRGASALVLRYELIHGEAPVELELRPLFAPRDADHLYKEGEKPPPAFERTERGVRLLPEGLPPVELSFPAEHLFAEQPDFYRDTCYGLDQERGFEGREDHFTPGVVRIRLEPRKPAFVAATTGVAARRAAQDPRGAFEDEVRRRRRLLEDAEAHAPSLGGSSFARRLFVGAEDFLYRDTHGRPGVLAGFPWFGEWGRDVFIALPGLTLARGRPGECAEVLAGALPFLREGLLPNIYAASAEDSHYGSVDASLWYSRAVQLFEDAGGSPTLLREELLPALVEIATSYWNGTGLGVRADEEGLIQAGGDGLNPTWMDARTSEGPVTPRAGFAVEINALWIALLGRVAAFLADEGRGEEARLWSERLGRAEAAFLERFWLEDEGRLADTWSPEGADTSLRPNMLFAAALERSPLSLEQRRGIVAAARRELVTPVGLRPLSPDDASYRPVYRGGPEERDRAYHQGTVWPWLLGFYTEAALRAHPGEPEVLVELEALWDGVDGELDRAGLNHVSEVFDGEDPHRPGGTMAQAWNTGESLRARRLLHAARAAQPGTPQETMP